jgi:hypothetical protein
MNRDSVGCYCGPSWRSEQVPEVTDLSALAPSTQALKRQIWKSQKVESAAPEFGILHRHPGIFLF